MAVTGCLHNLTTTECDRAASSPDHDDRYDHHDCTEAPAPGIIWTIEQIAIFAWFSLVTVATDLIVRARAGTGKTTTIIEGVKRYVDACRAVGTRTRVLVAAFNKEIATELEARIKGYEGNIDAKTLHALGFMFVRMAWKGVRVDFGTGRSMWLASKACPNASDEVIELVAELNRKAREIEPFASDSDNGPQLIEDLALQFDLVPNETMSREGWTMDKISRAVLRSMDYAMERTATIDGSDMIFLPLVHNWVRPTYDRVVIDEAQDMTMAQLLLAQQACKETGKICVVGDDRQAIYGFRGADSGSLDRLKSELGATELGLTVTYRCGSKIVAEAQAIVPDYQCAANAHEGNIHAINADKMMYLARPGDFIISRKNAPLASICLSLLKDGIRAYIRGKDIGRGLIAIIRKLRIREIADLSGALATWYTKQSDFAEANLSPDKATERCSYLADQRDVIIALSDGCATLSEVIGRIETLFSDDKGTPRVMLSTVHKAKGLEASNVFILDGTFRANGGIEESNIRYVAITRAKQNLYHVSGYESKAPELN